MSNDIVAFGNEMEGLKDHLFKMAMPSVDKDRYMAQVRAAAAKNEKILHCEWKSVWLAVAQALSLNLNIGIDSYIVPHGRTATLIAGYKGLKTLAFRSGLLRSLEMRTVWHGDEFDYQFGTDEFLRHRPAGDSAKIWTHVYAIAKLANGGRYIQVMTHKQIQIHKEKYCRGGKHGPWSSDESTMAEKTVLLRVLKLLPQSQESQEVIRNTELRYHEVLESTNKPVSVPPQDLDQLAETIKPEPQGK